MAMIQGDEFLEKFRELLQSPSVQSGAKAHKIVDVLEDLFARSWIYCRHMVLILGTQCVTCGVYVLCWSAGVKIGGPLFTASSAHYYDITHIALYILITLSIRANHSTLYHITEVFGAKFGYIKQTKNHGTYRIDLIVALFGRIVDLHNFEFVVSYTARTTLLS